MKLILIILGVVAVVLNVILWTVKKRAGKAKEGESSDRMDGLDDNDTRPREIEGHPNIGPLKESAAAELGIEVEQLNRMSVDEITEMAIDKGLI